MQALDAYRSATDPVSHRGIPYLRRNVARLSHEPATEIYSSHAGKHCRHQPSAYLRHLAVTLAMTHTHRRPVSVQRVLLRGQVRRVVGDNVLCEFVGTAGEHYTGRVPSNRFFGGVPRVAMTFEVCSLDRGSHVEVWLRPVEPPDMLRDPIWLAGHRERVDSLVGVDEWFAASRGTADGQEATGGSKGEVGSPAKADDRDGGQPTAP